MAQTKEQQRASSQKHYQANKAKIKTRARLYTDQNRTRLREFCRELKAAAGCADCGNANWVVLEFDHVRGPKTSNIADMIRRSVGLSTLKTEIDKCDIVCRNCHAIRTFERAGGGSESQAGS